MAIPSLFCLILPSALGRLNSLLPEDWNTFRPSQRSSMDELCSKQSLLSYLKVMFPLFYFLSQIFHVHGRTVPKHVEGKTGYVHALFRHVRFLVSDSKETSPAVLVLRGQPRLWVIFTGNGILWGVLCSFRFLLLNIVSASILLCELGGCAFPHCYVAFHSRSILQLLQCIYSFGRKIIFTNSESGCAWQSDFHINLSLHLGLSFLMKCVIF